MSQVVDHFILVNGYFECKYCTKKYKKDSTGSTANRNKHLVAAHPEVLKKKEPVKSNNNDFFAPRLAKNDLSRSMVRLFSEFNLPYHVADSNSFLEFVKCLNINAKVNFLKSVLFLSFFIDSH